MVKLLDKNPLLTARAICSILHISYRDHRRNIWNIKSKWKTSPDFRQGLKSLSFHNTRFFGYALKELDRRGDRGDGVTVVADGVTGAAVSKGWILTRARNKMLVWVDRSLLFSGGSSLGRIEWFRTGRIKGYIKKPVSKGKILQLLANAFYKTSLVDDIDIFHEWANSFSLWGSHLVYDTGERLPYAQIKLLKDSNGVIVTIGDKSHPTSIEVQFCYPDWAERNEIMLGQNIKALDVNSKVIEGNSKMIELNTKQNQQFSDLMKDLSTPKKIDDKNNRMVV